METAVAQLIAFIVGGLCTFIVTYIVMFGTLRKGVLALLRYRLFAECERIINRGYITSDELTDLDSLHEAYKGLKGNGTGDTLHRLATAQSLQVTTNSIRKGVK